MVCFRGYCFSVADSCSSGTMISSGYVLDLVYCLVRLKLLRNVNAQLLVGSFGRCSVDLEAVSLLWMRGSCADERMGLRLVSMQNQIL
jgi:hypothetical protein